MTHKMEPTPAATRQWCAHVVHVLARRHNKEERQCLCLWKWTWIWFSVERDENAPLHSSSNFCSLFFLVYTHLFQDHHQSITTMSICSLCNWLRAFSNHFWATFPYDDGDKWSIPPLRLHLPNYFPASCICKVTRKIPQKYSYTTKTLQKEHEQ